MYYNVINIKSKYYKDNISKVRQLGDFQNHRWRNKGPKVNINLSFLQIIVIFLASNLFFKIVIAQYLNAI